MKNHGILSNGNFAKREAALTELFAAVTKAKEENPERALRALRLVFVPDQKKDLR